MTARITHITFHIDAEIEGDITNPKNPKLNKFDITDLGILEVDVGGLWGPLNWLAGNLVEFLGNWLNTYLANIVEGPIKTLIEGELEKLGK